MITGENAFTYGFHQLLLEPVSSLRDAKAFDRIPVPLHDN